MKISNVKVRDVTYHVEQAGAGDPLVLLHGFTGSTSNWHPLLPILTKQFHVMMIDIPGHGQSSAPDNPNRYRMAEIGEDLNEIIHQMFADPVNLLGYSMGGRLALFMAVHYPNRWKRLILESASPGLATHEEQQERIEGDEQFAQRILQQGIPSFVDFWEQIPLFASQQSLPDDVRDRLRNQRLQNSSHGLANSLRGMGTGVQPSLWGNLPELSMPVLLLTGALDTKFVNIAGRMGEHIPSVRHVTIPDAGHTVHLEQPDAFCTEVGHFLNS